MDRETANELYGYESRRSGPGLDRRLAALGISPRSYSERKERERSGEVRGDIPTPRPSPSSPHLNYPTGGGISR